MSDDVVCMRHKSATVPVGEDPQYGTVYQCLHDPDHLVTAPDGDVQVGWTRPGPLQMPKPECVVFKCLAAPTEFYADMRSGRRQEFVVCETHKRELEGGADFRRYSGKLLLGDDKRIADGG